MSYVSNWQMQSLPKGKLWYPLQTNKVKRMIMEEAYLAGFTVKEISFYFRISLWGCYEKINIKALKKRLKEVN